MRIGVILALLGAGGLAFFVIRQRRLAMMGIGDESDPGFVGPPSNLANLVTLEETVGIGNTLFSPDKGPTEEKMLVAVA